MKNKMIIPCILIFLTIHLDGLHAQVFRASATEALRNSGGLWIQEKLPPSLLTFSDYSGEVKIRTTLSSLFRRSDSLSAQVAANAVADFTMTLDKEQIKQQPVSLARTFNTTGWLLLNGVSRKIVAQCELIPRINPDEGFNVSVTIRFNPADFDLTMVGEITNDPLIVKVANGYLNKSDNNLGWR